ncbi:HlyC/CorC family transporter [Sulfuricella sp.]|uniref:HlyC/CorC family transporter n=1 Tax=Sulfuricella sp. TaxID=2099377 RepID=UPI002BBAADAD|nr:HlyC/CorC family transporter [Sulfuricella sp.]HUX62901.1 HlyC/CorC family transporter [Sulfuricella sp.]
MDDISTSLLLVTLLLLLIGSGFFSIAEISMMALNRYRLKHMAKRGHRGAKLTMQLLEKTDKLLGVILLGNNLLNAAAAALVTVITVRLMGESEFALTIGTLSVTFLILVFSEITPKVLAAAYPERIAIPASYILAPLLKLFYPVVWFVNLFVRSLLWLLHLTPSSVTTALNMEELRTLVLEAGHYIPPKHQSIFLNLFELENVSVDDVMIPRNQIEAIDLDAPEEMIREQLATSHHTRLPVYRGRLDNIVGVIHIRHVLHQVRNNEINTEMLQEIVREPYFIPAGTSLFSQLQHFQENRHHIGLVVDEYGELLGLVSLEDILEEIVGEFASRPTAHGGIYPQDDGSWLVDGGCSLRDLNRKLKLNLPLDGPKTLNGLILEHFEDIPEAGTSFKIDGHTLEIVQTQDRIVKVVRIFPLLSASE